MIQISDIHSFWQLGPRDNQEDYMIPADGNIENRIFVLCDGMGGHGHGEVASKVVAESVYHYLSSLQCDRYTPEMLQQAVDKANGELARADSFHDERAMGTTLVVVVLNNDSLLIGHIGDSRCYVFDKKGNIKFRTQDHSLVAQAVANGIITEEEAFTSPKKNIITRCVMARQETPTIDVDIVQPESGDSIMLCSDGVSDAIRDADLVKILSRGIGTLSSYCEQNATDNNTLLMVRLTSDSDRKVLKNVTGNGSVFDSSENSNSKRITTKEIPNSMKANLFSSRGLIFGLVIILAIGAAAWAIFRPSSASTKEKSKTEVATHTEATTTPEEPMQPELDTSPEVSNTDISATPDEHNIENMINNPSTTSEVQSSSEGNPAPSKQYDHERKKVTVNPNQSPKPQHEEPYPRLE